MVTIVPMTNAHAARTAEPAYRRRAARHHVGQPLALQNDRFESFAFEVVADDRTDEELMASLVDDSLDAYGEEPFDFVRVEHVNGVHRLYCPDCDGHVDTLTAEAYAEACDEGRLVDVARGACAWCTRDDLLEEAPVPAYRNAGGIATQCPTCKVRTGGALSVEQLVAAAERGQLAQVAECNECSLRGLV